MPSPDTKAMLEDLDKAIQSIGFLESDLRSAIKRCHGPLALTAIPLAAAVEQTCELSRNLRQTRSLLIESTEA